LNGSCATTTNESCREKTSEKNSGQHALFDAETFMNVGFQGGLTGFVADLIANNAHRRGA